MFLREPSFFSRRVSIAVLLVLCTISLCLWQLLGRKSFPLHPDPPSDRIYDLHIEGSQNNEPPKPYESSPESSTTEVIDTDEGYLNCLILAKICTEERCVQK